MAYTTADAQFLRDKDNKLILKEFAVYYPDFSESYLSVATFAPPYEKQCSPQTREKTQLLCHTQHSRVRMERWRVWLSSHNQYFVVYDPTIQHSLC